ncbi:MAG TPA: type VI secretion system-associated FHA domain protein TagH [Gammaproteobacteria bacterium]
MALQLTIVSEHRDLVGDDYVREFHEQGGTIGRSLGNDWILPDPDRYISGRHATIDYKGGMYYLADTSSNGVYMNDEREPVGKGNPRRLFNGDRIRMGDFHIEVAIDSGESLAMPLEPKSTVVPDNIEQLVDEEPLHTGVQLLDEDELTGDSDFQSILFGKPDGDIEQLPRKAAPAREEAPVSERAPRPEANSGVDVTAEDLFDTFLDGLGISRVELHPSVNRPELMMSAGLVLREFVEGTIKLLSSRANLKNAFRLDQTTVLPRHNNPMKFSDNTNDLLKQLLVGTEGEYLGARDAVRETCRDLINHQNAFLDAMNSAFVEFADRFDPDELEEGFDRALNSKLLSFGNKSKYWNLYRELYPIMTEKGGGRFPQMFAEEFVKAYERQVAEFQRQDREGRPIHPTADHVDHEIPPEFLATQKLERPIAEITESDDETGPDDFVEIDQSFVEDLENSMAEALPHEKRKTGDA